MYNLFTMENKEVLSTKERVLLIIQAICLMIFLAWLDIAFNFEEIGPATIIILSVSGGVFLIAFIIYIIPVIKARKAIKASFYNSIYDREKLYLYNNIENKENDIFDNLDNDSLKIDDQNVLNADNKDENK